jgi:CTP synthase
VPFFGICYGFQWATVEFARNVCGSTAPIRPRCDENAPHKVIYKLRDLLGVDDLGGTMRLGATPASSSGSVAQRIYGSD